MPLAPTATSAPTTAGAFASYEALQLHMLARFAPLIVSQWKRHAGALDLEDAKQEANLWLFREWMKASKGNPPLTVAAWEGLFAVGFPRHLEARVSRDLSLVKKPASRSRYQTIRLAAKRTGREPREICESMGLSLAEFDRITALVAHTLHMDTDGRGGADLYAATDEMVHQAQEGWSDLVAGALQEAIAAARGTLTQREDAVIEAFYWTLTANAASTPAVAELLTERFEERFTPSYVRHHHANAIGKLREALAYLEDGYVEPFEHLDWCAVEKDETAECDCA